MSRLGTLQTRLSQIEIAIQATLERNASSYSTEIQSLSSLGLDELYRLEKATQNEIAKLRRGNRFGKLGFKDVSDA